VGSKTIDELAKFLQSAVVTFLPARTDDETALNVTAYVLLMNGAKPGSQPLTKTTEGSLNSILSAQKVQSAASVKPYDSDRR
jgi:hypothetical protein